MLALAVACHHRAGPPVPVAQVTLDDARHQFRHGQFPKALRSFQRLTFELPANDSTLAEVHYYLAECYFQTGEHVTAAHEFRETADQFPSSPYAPLALLRAGDANLRLWRTPELDPAYGEAALAIYQELAGRYAGTDAAARAQLHVRRLREWFADKAYNNGMFYFRRRAWDSGIIYFKYVIATYPEARRAADAVLRLADTYKILGYKDELRETCANLQRYYPQAAAGAKSCPADSGTASR
jgi:outer membrane assembly lipoprotein YfiO